MTMCVPQQVPDGEGLKLAEERRGNLLAKQDEHAASLLQDAPCDDAGRGCVPCPDAQVRAVKAPQVVALAQT